MKKLPVLLLLLLITLLGAAGAARAADYANVKGDYLIFRLGDSEAVTVDKINYLLRTSRIRDAERSDSGYIRFYASLLGKDVYTTVNFDGDRLLEYLDFQVESGSDLAETLATDYLKNLRQLFAELYGAGSPIPLPPEADLGDDRQYPFLLWQLADKYLLLSVSHYVANDYTVWLEIHRGTFELPLAGSAVRELTPEELRDQSRHDFN
ncbi:hypothetical protein EDC14_1001179 [Hydrogenispora ethanolica]|uniref:Uncharacterized protein n=1 Tax=Hydrogenispora ethanolica TaxID=1082276 RepID=A0A4R1SC57_HYDET|nr:hypothetical protein [Hydrogenispora ethanolica]TCL76894.1 hypothetical protein EDC14_1001179 [Hydrogenispora ethanolica]